MPKLDVAFFKPFVEGTVETLKVQCSTEAKSGKPFFKGQQEQPPFELTGVIALQSNTFCGTIALCFQEKVFLSIMSSMLGEEFTEITTDLEDGAAELLNIIFGHAKRILNDKGYKLDKAIPTVIRGKDLATRHTTQEPAIVLPFEAAGGFIQMEISAEASSLDV